MPSESILEEVQHLNNVSERLESMAPNHPRLEEALLTVSGNIRNIALNAAFVAAEAGQPIHMAHLLTAARAEYGKLERPLAEAEIGGWL